MRIIGNIPGLRGVGVYVALVWFEICCLLTLGMLIGIVVLTPVYQEDYRVVPMRIGRDNTSYIGPVEYSYPYFEPLISGWVCALLVILGPIVLVAAFQITIRSWWDLHRAVFGNLKAVILAWV
jgi:hypothetical protein